MHSLQDLKTLRNAANTEIGSMIRSYTTLVESRPISPDWRHAFSSALGDLQSRFAQASSYADAKIQAFSYDSGKASEIPADEEYGMLASALSPLKDLRHRLAVVGQGTSDFGGDPASFPAQAIVTTAQTGAAGRLNVRAAASTSGKVLGAFEHGQGVTLTGPSQNGFFPVAFGQGSGFSSASFLTPILAQPAADAPLPQPTPGAPIPPQVAAGTPAIVTTAQTGPAGRLNVRSSPSATAAVVGQFEHGQTIEITGATVAGFFPVRGMGTGGRSLAGFSSSTLVRPSPGGNVPPLPAPLAPQVTPPQPQNPQAGPTVTPPRGPMQNPQAGPMVPGKQPTPNAPSQGGMNLGQPAPSGALVPANAAGNLAAVAPNRKNLYIAGGIVGVLAIGGGIYAATHKKHK